MQLRKRIQMTCHTESSSLDFKMGTEKQWGHQGTTKEARAGAHVNKTGPGVDAMKFQRQQNNSKNLHVIT